MILGRKLKIKLGSLIQQTTLAESLNLKSVIVIAKIED